MIKGLQARSLGEALKKELDLVRSVATSHPTKYDRIKGLMKNRTGAKTAVCYISDLSRQWTPRVGQALLGLPQGLVLLASESLSRSTKQEGNYANRLAELLGYVGRIEFAVVFVGTERKWTPELVAGPEDSPLREALEVAFPEARSIAVSIPDRTPLPFPPRSPISKADDQLAT